MLIVNKEKQNRWDHIHQVQVLTAQWTWLGMFGNGVRIGMMEIIIAIARTEIRRGRGRGVTVFFAAGRGSTTPTTCALRAATSSIRRTGTGSTTTSGFVVLGLLNPLLFVLLPFALGLQGHCGSELPLAIFETRRSLPQLKIGRFLQLLLAAPERAV